MEGKHIYKKTAQKQQETGLKLVLGFYRLPEFFSHNKKYAKTEWLCQCKREKEEEGHILSGKCNVYSDLISQFGDLAEDKNLVQFFQAVLDRREELEEEDRRQQSLTAAVIARPDHGNVDRTSRPGDLYPIGTT